MITTKELLRRYNEINTELRETAFLHEVDDLLREQEKVINLLNCYSRGVTQ